MVSAKAAEVRTSDGEKATTRTRSPPDMAGPTGRRPGNGQATGVITTFADAVPFSAVSASASPSTFRDSSINAY